MGTHITAVSVKSCNSALRNSGGVWDTLMGISGTELLGITSRQTDQLESMSTGKTTRTIIYTVFEDQ